MVIMRIHCNACGGIWEVYSRQRKTDAARICPHCEHQISKLTWEANILPAYKSAAGANMALAFDSMENHSAEFQVDFIADSIFKNAPLQKDIQNDG